MDGERAWALESETRPSPPSHGQNLKKITSLLGLSFRVCNGGIKIVLIELLRGSYGLCSVQHSHCGKRRIKRVMRLWSPSLPCPGFPCLTQGVGVAGRGEQAGLGAQGTALQGLLF